MPRSHVAEHTFGRAAFLRAGAFAAAGVAVGPAATARAGAPTPTPVDDDLGFLQFTATGELVAISLGAALLATPGFSRAERARLEAARAGTKAHYVRLAAVLGADAPQYGDFHIKLPAHPARTRERMLATAYALGTLVARVYVAGAAGAADPATRELLARLLWSEAQHLASIRVLQHLPALAGGLPSAIALDDAAPLLDAFLGDADLPA
jgi:hypothetical protein